MAVEVDVRLAADQFAFGQVFDDVPGLHVEFDRVVPVGRSEDILPFVWVIGTAVTPDPESVEDALRASEDVADFTLLTAAEGHRLYQLDWNAGVEGVLDGVRASGGSIVEGSGEGGEWRFRLRFPSQDDLRSFDDYCEGLGIRFTLERLMDVPPPQVAGLDLTADQREALRVAFEHGYFEVPRGVTLAELSDHLGISHQAASERLRRATGNALAAVLGEFVTDHSSVDEGGDGGSQDGTGGTRDRDGTS